MNLKKILVAAVAMSLMACSAPAGSTAASTNEETSSSTTEETSSSTTEETSGIIEIGGTSIDDMKTNPDNYIGKQVSFSAFFVEGDQVGMIASVLGPGDIKYVGASDTCNITVGFKDGVDTSALTYVEKKNGIIDSFDAMKKNTALIGNVESISEDGGILKISFKDCDFKPAE